VRALAHALDTALSTPAEERRAIARAAREHVLERHDMHRYAGECVELLRAVSGARRV
jgi:trehalose-6-phosphate synthase